MVPSFILVFKDFTKYEIMKLLDGATISTIVHKNNNLGEGGHGFSIFFFNVLILFNSMIKSINNIANVTKNITKQF